MVRRRSTSQQTSLATAAELKPGEKAFTAAAKKLPDANDRRAEHHGRRNGVNLPM